jgi:hypothetical protein
MSTFCAVDDATLIALIQDASKRIVFIAPGVHELVATALGKRFQDIDGLDVTVVLDPNEEVCRNGYGDIKGLELVYQYAQKSGFWVRCQPGLRVGVLLADDKTLVWSPTPRSIEAPPVSLDSVAQTALIEATAPTTEASRPVEVTQPQPQPPPPPKPPLAPNGLLLGSNPAQQLAKAVAAEGINADPHRAEIGKSAITPAQLKATQVSIERNPVIPVDLARVAHVFSSKLQFVELEIKGAKISRTQLTVPSQLLNADAKGELQGLIQSKLSAFSEFKTVEVSVPAFHNGLALEGQMDQVSEASLHRARTALEKKYIWDITGYGRLVARDDKKSLETQVEALKVQLLAHSKELKKLIEQQSTEIIDSAVDLIMDRASRTGSSFQPKPDELRKILQEGLNRGKAEDPKVTLVFKDVTFEQTKNDDFRNRVKTALPAHKQKQLGAWAEHFDAAREAGRSSVNKVAP